MCDRDLHFAALTGTLRLATDALDSGVNPGVVSADGVQDTPLHVAARGGHLQVAQLLTAKGAPVNACNARAQTPLHYAASKGQAAVAALLLSLGATVDAADFWEMTPLHYASGGGHLPVVQLLLSHGANAAAVGGDGYTPLPAAAFSGQPEVIKLLLRRGAYSDEELREAVQVASLQSHASACVAVLRHVAAGRPKDVLRKCIASVQPGNRECVMEALVLANVDASAGYDEQVAALDKEREQMEAEKRGARVLFVQSAMHLKRAEQLVDQGRRDSLGSEA